MSARRYALATAPRKDAAWTQEAPVTWDGFLARLRACRCDVAGTVDGPARNEDTVLSRSVLTLDEDGPSSGWLLDVRTTLDAAHGVHTTKSSTPEAPRYRLLVPLSPGLVAAKGGQRGERLGSFHSFGNHAEPQAVAEFDG